MKNKLKKIVIATGGTGGHVFPAFSLAEHFSEKGINVKITSDKRGLRYLKNFKDLKITLINSSSVSKKNIFKFIFAIIVVFFAIVKSLGFLLFNRPNLVFGMGGYSSFPVCVAAKLLYIPFIIYENNLYIGKANKYLLPFAKKIFVSNKELEGVVNKDEEKVCEIGNIVRKEILNFENKIYFNGKDRVLKILVLGGSQAAKIFAEELPKIFKECIEAKISLKIYQQCLPEQTIFLENFYRESNIDFKIFNFSNDILDYFSKANLAITRSGSSILAELINVKLPFISVPLPSSADNHQLKNAIYYEKNKYSYLVEEKDLKSKLFKLIKKIYEDTSLLDQIVNKQKQFSDKTVYENIDKQIKKVTNEEY